MKRLCRAVLLLSIAAVSALSGGCGEEEVFDPRPSGPINIPIRIGTWSIQEVVTYTGSDSCLARDSTIVDTTEILCSFDLGETSSRFITTDCEIDTVGGEVVFDCTIRADLGICVQIIEIAGGGTMTDSTFDLSSVLVTRLIPAEGVTDSTCNFFYGNFIDACSTLIESRGTWLNSNTIISIETDSTTSCTSPPCTTYACGEPPDSLQTIPLQSFMQRSALQDFWRR